MMLKHQKPSFIALKRSYRVKHTADSLHTSRPLRLALTTHTTGEAVFGISKLARSSNRQCNDREN